MNMEQFRGPVKIKDGLYMGDLIAAQDLEFLMTNKVTYIINCAGRQVKNLWESIGVVYVTFPFQESDREVLFDSEGRNLQRVLDTVQAARQKGESCLIHSEKGQSRCSCIVTAFLMSYYKWSLYKCLEFLNSRRPDLEIRTSFFKQLNQLEQAQCSGGQSLSNQWVSPEDPPCVSTGEEQLVSKTYVNSLVGKVTNINQRQYTTISRKLMSMPGPPRTLTFNPQIQVFHLKSLLTGTLQYSPSRKPARQSIKSASTSRNYSLKGTHQKTKSLAVQKGEGQKINNIQGNIIHVTVNNFLGPSKEEEIEEKQQNLRQSSDEVYENILQKYSTVNHPRHKKSNSFSTIQNSQKSKQLMAKPFTQQKKSLNKKYQPTPPRQYLNSSRVPGPSKQPLTASHLLSKELNHPHHSKSHKQDLSLSRNKGESLSQGRHRVQESSSNQKYELGNTKQEGLLSQSQSYTKVTPFKQDSSLTTRVAVKVNTNKFDYLDKSVAQTRSPLLAKKSLSSNKHSLSRDKESKQMILDLKSNQKIMNNFYNNKYKKL